MLWVGDVRNDKSLWFGKGPGEGTSYFDVARGKMVVASLSDGAMFGCMFVGDGKEIGDVLIGERVKLNRP